MGLFSLSLLGSLVSWMEHLLPICALKKAFSHMGKDDFPKHVNKSQGQLYLSLTPLKSLGSEPQILLSHTRSPSPARSLL